MKFKILYYINYYNISRNSEPGVNLYLYLYLYYINYLIEYKRFIYIDYIYRYIYVIHKNSFSFRTKKLL